MAAKAELKAFLGINSKQFERGLVRARAQANDFAKKGMMVAGAAVVTFGAALVAGSRKIMATGADLDHLRRQSGAAVKDLMVLQRAMKDGGISAQQLGRNLRELNVNLDGARDGTGKAADAMRELGLSADDLIRMSATERIKAISAALDGISDPARRSALAVALLGTRGSEMITGLDPAAIDDAAKSLGRMPEIMDDFAAAFERVDTIMGRLPDLANQFFTGFASEIVGSILDPLEEVNELDFTELGQNLGKAIAPWLEAIKGGEVWDLFSLHGIKAVSKFGAMLVDGFANTAIVGGAALAGSLKWAANSFVDTMLGGIATIADSINTMLAKLPDWMGGSARIDTDALRGKKSGGQGGLGDSVNQAIANAPELNLRGKVDETFDPAITQLMNQLEGRAGVNRERAKGMRGEDAEPGSPSDPEERESALAGAMALARGGAGSRAASSGAGAPTDFWRVVERDLSGAITNWDQLSDRQKERFANEAPEGMQTAIQQMDAQEHQERESSQQEQSSIFQQLLDVIKGIDERLAGLVEGAT